MLQTSQKLKITTPADENQAEKPGKGWETRSTNVEILDKFEFPNVLRFKTRLPRPPAEKQVSIHRGQALRPPRNDPAINCGAKYLDSVSSAE